MGAALASLVVFTLPARALLVAALPAAELDVGTTDAGSPWGDPIYAGCEAAPQPTELPDGSWLLTPARGRRNACLLGACEDHRERLQAGPPVISGWTLLFAAVVGTLALIGGLYLGFEARALGL